MMRLSTAEAAAASGYSHQQIRDLEHTGVIPAASRRANGYREFDEVHLHALRAYRELAIAVGPVVARRTLSEVWNAESDVAAALLSALHVDLMREREQALDALAALRAIGGEPDAAPADAMTITELSAALGVRASTLRFWEDEDLVHPERVTARAARSYPPAAIREARIVAALRAAAYRIPQVHATITALRSMAEIDGPITALESRLGAISERMSVLLRVGAVILELYRR
ncbi:MerR family transcriptional regulator [Microbacterium murale]|uniref:DNA-binding transcriptional MerR regulator n=1 Tax=Microbacterium murale TaxID=1081040 RepID=A0ABU0P7L9_9MICO|nr:MerR family transcriptional regulator [Microbacterium murale]MDQ0643337.1 DNA-binding transcriptional MerR regulator [Microbacterium murale]